jgi:hypothetical protein
MRVFQFVFAIWGFFACRDFSVTIDMDCNDKMFQRRIEIEYPFDFAEHICRRKADNQTLFVSIESSTGAQFFVITAVLSILYALFIIFVYAYLDEMYKSKPEFPMAVRIFYVKSIIRSLIEIPCISGLRVDWHPCILLVGCHVQLQQRRKCFRKDLRRTIPGGYVCSMCA